MFGSRRTLLYTLGQPPDCVGRLRFTTTRPGATMRTFNGTASAGGVMTENEGITNDIRAREEEYFRRKDRELVERMRQAEVEKQVRQELESRSGIHDPAMLQELEALGFTPDTVS